MSSPSQSRRWQLHAQLSGIREALEHLETQVEEVDRALLGMNEQETVESRPAPSERPVETPAPKGTPLAIAAG